MGLVFSNVDFTWVKAFITESIEQELDFLNEAKQCEKLGRLRARARWRPAAAGQPAGWGSAPRPGQGGGYGLRPI